MILRKFVFLIFILATLAFTGRDSAIKNMSVIVTPESSLLVRGTTNISNFSCEFNINNIKNPVPVNYYNDAEKITFDNTALILDTACFDCGGKAINKDFQDILKADKYPQIFLYLKQIHPVGNNADVQALIDIEIAGITKSYKIPVKVKKSNGLLITGDLGLSLSDYRLEPPKKLFGLISVDDQIAIYFQLLVREN